MELSVFFRKHLLRKILFAALFLAFYYLLQFLHAEFGSGGFFAKTIPFEDVTQKMIITLSRSPNQNTKGRLSVRVTGELSGMAVIHQLYDGEKKATYVIGPGKVDLKMNGPWEYPKCSLFYEPQNVASGRLGVTYRFS